MVLGSRNIHYVVVKLIILLLLSTTSLKAEGYSWSIEKINEKNVMVLFMQVILNKKMPK